MIRVAQSFLRAGALVLLASPLSPLATAAQPQLSLYLEQCQRHYGDKPHVLIQTEYGQIDIEVYLAAAPVTACNFLRYAEAGYYSGGTFFRVVRPTKPSRTDAPISVVQAKVNDRAPSDAFGAIALENTQATGIHHEDGAVSMARADVADSATSDFFICIGRQPSLDYGGNRSMDRKGFAAFGRVVEGMDTVRRIYSNAATDEELTHPVRMIHVRTRSSVPN